MQMKNIRPIILFCSGIIIGILLIVGFGFYLIREDAGKPLVGPKIFGDITVYRIRSSEKDRLDPGIYESMVLERNGHRLAQVNLSNADTSSQMVMYGDSIPIVKVQFAEERLQNPVLAYGRFQEESSYPIQKFVDLDMNGQFDFVMNLDKEGNATYVKIFLSETQTWEVPSQIDIDHDRAVVNDREYEFHPYHGWQSVAK
jgi:hypothetical protein